ncbi:C69 family dipeptidase [Neobacillus sp. YIM B02564]|uniref:Dipeptidase n=1 Tax=Neobacillus paridis TaxID=2803862 RepID=A0ABS1THP6_9BACI|nr:C69 family dipeptidase [Neobacillus paridis]MBL4950841.1 C69 family dipeptidase [Neobacillus paridis]
MKAHRMKRAIAAVASTALLVGGFAFPASACTSVFAGKKATADGSVLVARNEDVSSAWSKHVKVFPRKTHKKGEKQKFVTGLTVTQPSVSYKYIAVPDWDPSEGPFEEAGINEYGVAVSATNSAYANEKAEKADPFIAKGVTESVIPSLILPRVKTARDGAKLLGQYIEKYGSAEANGLAIADKNEIWYFEVATGHQWVAERVPDTKYLIVANGLRIDNYNQNDTKNFMGSKTVISYAVGKGLITNYSKDKPFDFAGTYGEVGQKYNSRREWWGERTFTPSITQNAELQRYPLFMTPDKKITPKQVMKFLGSHYEGTPYDPSTPTGKDERAVGVDRTVESHVIQLRANKINNVMWLSLANPEYSVYLPFYAAILDTPTAYKHGNDIFSTDSAYWAFRAPAALAATDPANLGVGVKNYWGKYEDKLLAKQPSVEKEALNLYKKDPKKAIDYLNKYSNKTAEDAYSKSKTLRNELITKIASHSKGVFNPDL